MQACCGTREGAGHFVCLKQRGSARFGRCRDTIWMFFRILIKEDSVYSEEILSLLSGVIQYRVPGNQFVILIQRVL